ncbi:MAG TPA: chemotaxis protein CheW [Candidatus Margulisbacteria bacterium]|nr:chemotaxis protein CheW [Candidatus Margulisiibacteriota bacterium]HCT84700.1 chemotaxis protein CheW [Candidatus Margulisiibacteriota bacterium]HCY35826.1 chemotaxis protein CheW [Candidatus Margulisiibacteriota bacterium]
MIEDDSWDEDDEDTMKNRYLTFHIADEDFGIDILYVKEIVGMQKITEVPDMPAFIKGVINLRGQVIPLIDVRLRFEIELREYDERTCVIVVDINSMLVGLVVDMVSEVTEIPEESISPPPQLAYSTSHQYIKGMGKIGEEVKIILDIQKLLFEQETKLLAESM